MREGKLGTRFKGEGRREQKGKLKKVGIEGVE
jgi:hypothetical protein